LSNRAIGPIFSIRGFPYRPVPGLPDPLIPLVLATRNPGKVAELAAALQELPVALLSAADVGAPEVEEDAGTLRGFRTVLAFADGEGVRFFEGVCEGEIATQERGTGGFGYDALFRPTEGDGRLFSEMTTGEKNRISHRGRAVAAFVAFLSKSLHEA
jgi:inosine/xanthosine triphosphate pyrophosphatase family protein